MIAHLPAVHVWDLEDLQVGGRYSCVPRPGNKYLLENPKVLTRSISAEQGVQSRQIVVHGIELRTKIPVRELGVYDIKSSLRGYSCATARCLDGTVQWSSFVTREKKIETGGKFRHVYFSHATEIFSASAQATSCVHHSRPCSPLVAAGVLETCGCIFYTGRQVDLDVQIAPSSNWHERPYSSKYRLSQDY